MASNRPLSPEFIDRVARRFRTLGDATRLQILQSLMSGPKSVSEIVGATNKGQANVSKHLAVLADAGILARKRDGTRIIYDVADPMVMKLCDLVCGSIRHRLANQVKEHERLLRTK